jgi:hypothetical protein
MKTNNKNKKIKVYSLSVVLMSVLLAGVFMQSCNSDALDSFSDESNPNAKYFEVINSIQSQDLQIVLESVFQTAKKIEGGSNVYVQNNADNHGK